MRKRETEEEQELEVLLVSMDEAARVLSVGRTTIYTLIEDGSIKQVKIGRRSLITADSLRAYVAGLTSP